MTEFTRTPWRMEQNSSYRGLYDVYDVDGNVIARAKTLEVARLITAAPDLLAGGQNIVIEADSWEDCMPSAVLAIIDEEMANAIAKATGNK